MYKISQFSRISEITVKALRYYDEENILKPTIRKEENQYRYYTDEDLKKAQLIKYLRSLNFSIMELKEVVETVTNQEDLTYILQEKIKHIEKHISKEKELLRKMNADMIMIDPSHNKNTYDIDIVEVKAQLVASIRFHGKYSDLDTYIPVLYKAVKHYKDGNYFNCYFDEECVEDADIELCLPIKKTIQNTAITCKMTPKVKAIRTLHYGSYDQLYLAYKALFTYVNAHGYQILFPTRELYKKGPGMIFKGNPANYITEILLPFE